MISVRVSATSRNANRICRKAWLRPRGLAPVVAYEISIKAIREGCKELLRLVASIHAGLMRAMVALQRFGSAAQCDPV
uniref:Tn3 family transposase n=1 Tax=Paraburkholderia heleia TaxID=634127 RepID=UPI0006946D98|nr:Tn3 family transposase [Paraburkholderia heleia]